MIEILALIVFLMFALFWLYYIGRTAKFGAPFVPLEPEIVERVMLHAAIKPGDVFYDLGSGDGRIVVAASLRGAQAYGVEIDKSKVLYSRVWLFMLRLNKTAEIIHQDFFKVNLSKADIVCLFLLQDTNEKLQEKLEKELKKGAKVISVAFTFPKWQPEIIDPHGPKYGPIYVYRR